MMLTRQCAWCGEYLGLKCSCGGTEKIEPLGANLYRCDKCHQVSELSDAITHGICPKCRDIHIPQPRTVQAEVQP